MSAATSYQASPIKRRRRTKADMDCLREAVLAVLNAEGCMTLRGLYYQLVSRGDIEKTEAQYDAIGRLCVQMRMDGSLPWRLLADSTRWMRKPDTYEGVQAALHEIAQNYKRALWSDAPVTVEVWCEKDALAGVLLDVTADWDVPLMVTRGFPSLSFLQESVTALAWTGKPAFIYYAGDHDPSGLAIDRNIQKRIADFAPDADITFERVAVLPWQIEQWGLPTRPTKGSDTRARNFIGESIEVDAIPSRTLKSIIEGCIRQHITEEYYDAAMAVEQSERDTLLDIAERFPMLTGRRRS